MIPRKLSRSILTLLQNQLQLQSPWVSAEELREQLRDYGVIAPMEEISREIEQLTRKGFLELRTVDSVSLSRGYIVRLTVAGRNRWVHGRSLTGD